YLCRHSRWCEEGQPDAKEVLPVTEFSQGGISGYSGILLDVSIPFIPPLFTWATRVPRASTPPSTCPPKMAVTPGEAPLNGTIVSPAPVSELIISKVK